MADDDIIRTERVSITIRGKKGRRTRAHSRGEGPRYGPFTRPIDDDVPAILSDVLWINKEALGLRCFDFTNKLAPSKPVDTVDVGGGLSQVIQNQTVVFDGLNLATVTKKKPIFAASLPYDSVPTGVVGVRTLWFITDRSFFAPESRLAAFDVTDINNPTLTAIYNLASAFAAPQQNIHVSTPFAGVTSDGNHVYVVGADSLVSGGQLNLCAYNTSNPLSVIQGTPQTLGLGATDLPFGNPFFQAAPTIVIDDVLYIGYTLGTPVTGVAPYHSYIAAYSLADPMNPLLTSLYSVTDLYGIDPTNSQPPTTIHVNKDRTRMIAVASFTIGSSPGVAGIADPFLMLFDVSGGLTNPTLVDRKSLSSRAFLDPTPNYLAGSDAYIVGNLVYAPKDLGTNSADLAIYDVSSGRFVLANSIDMQSDAGGGTLRSILALSIKKKGVPLGD